METTRIDTANTPFFEAFDIIEHSPASVMVTGRAGTGKTTFLNYLRQSTSKQTVVLAPTGVAAVNAGGQTIHSFFAFPPGLYDVADMEARMHVNKEEFGWMRSSPYWLDVVKSVERIVVDEVSMVRADLMDMMDLSLRYHRKSSLPFGGVQMVFIGDLFQLPPVVTYQESEALSQLYSGPYFMDSRAMSKLKLHPIVFEKVYRQSDPRFIALLDKIRLNSATELDIEWLNRRCMPATASHWDKYVHLFARVDEVNMHNSKELDKIDGEPSLYKASIDGNFWDKHIPAEMELELKIGARVMFLRNDWMLNIYNGLVGVVVEMGDDEVSVRLDSGRVVTVQRVVWENVVFRWNYKTKKVEAEVKGTFSQIPLRLAWAITVHKSQGLTFERIAVKLDRSFTSGQIYVALSRCKSYQGLRLISPIRMNQNPVDARVVSWCETHAESLLKDGEDPAEVLYRNCWMEYRRGHVTASMRWFEKAIREHDLTSEPVMKRFMRRYLPQSAQSETLEQFMKGAIV